MKNFILLMLLVFIMLLFTKIFLIITSFLSPFALGLVVIVILSVITYNEILK